MRADRYDFVVHGATGFTGREALRHLLSKPPQSLGRWAISGRDGGRLADLLATMAPDRDDIAILVADTSETDAMQGLAASTRVLVNLAGPYAKHGANILAACVEQRTHYLDLTGEIPWVRRMIEAIGHDVRHLDRVSYGGLNARGVRRGKWRRLSTREIGRLRRLVGLKTNPPVRR